MSKFFRFLLLALVGIVLSEMAELAVANAIAAGASPSVVMMIGASVGASFVGAMYHFA